MYSSVARASRAFLKLAKLYVADHLESAALFRIFGFFFCFPFNIPYPFRAIRMLSIPYYSRAFYPVLLHVLFTLY